MRSCTHVQSLADTTDSSISRAECLASAFAPSLPSVDAERPMHASSIAPHDASPRAPTASPGLHGTTRPAVRSPPFNGSEHSAARRKHCHHHRRLVYTPRRAVPSPRSELACAYAAAAKTLMSTDYAPKLSPPAHRSLASRTRRSPRLGHVILPAR